MARQIRPPERIHRAAFTGGIGYCRLYDEGYHRIGCIFCPFANVKTKRMDRLRYPGVERIIKRSIQVLIDTVDYGSK